MTEPTAIKFTRHRGQAITVDEAPPRARMDLRVLADRYAYLHMPAPDTIVFADQVVYAVVGYADGALDLKLVEDWRPKTDTEEKTVPTCTATIEGPHVLGGEPITCTLDAGHPGTHAGPNQDGRTLWTDHTAGATPHKEKPDA